MRDTLPTVPRKYLCLCRWLCFAVLLTASLSADDVNSSSKANGTPAQAETEKPAADREVSSDRYETKLEHDPNGIGKFYMGREIAHVMGFGVGGQGAQWLERSSREREERLTLLVKSLNLKPGEVIADIGAGSGVISLRMAEHVLPEGRILAVDVQDEMLERLKSYCEEFDVRNVVPVKGTAKSPNLEPASVDLAIMVDVYHEFEFPYEMMTEISKAMKPGGRVVFVEYRMEDPTVPIKLVHKMSQDQVKKEIQQKEFGLTFQETIGVLPRQHILVFTKSDPKTGDAPDKPAAEK